MNTIWGIDLGGTKIEGVVLDPQNFEILARHRVPTDSHMGYDHILSQISKLIHELQSLSQSKPTKMGMCTPGTFDPMLQTMKNSNSTALNGKNLRADLEKSHNIPFLLSNDANCFAVAEVKYGVIKRDFPEAKIVFGVIMGTGVGGGLVVDGQVINGLHGIGGEWGHNFLEEAGGLCYCGKTGCVETNISGPALERYYQTISGQKLPLKDIVSQYRNQNDLYAIQTMNRLFQLFGKAISVIINIIDPDVIVIGGGVGNIDELYTLGVECAKVHVFNPRLETKILKPILGDSAGVFGAAFL